MNNDFHEKHCHIGPLWASVSWSDSSLLVLFDIGWVKRGMATVRLRGCGSGWTFRPEWANFFGRTWRAKALRPSSAK